MSEGDAQVVLRERGYNIPQEILFEILARLPGKALMRFRCVCKSWNTLITSPDFINAHHEINAIQKNPSYDHLLIRTTKTCFSLYCQQTFVKCLDIVVSTPEEDRYFGRIYGSCNGLLCFSGIGASLKAPIYLWNPSIRKVKCLPQGFINKARDFVSFAIGVGFHGGENDYKVVKVASFVRKKIIGVEVYSLRLDAWRRISAHPPVSSHVIFIEETFTYLNGVVHWLIEEPIQQCTSILSFDVGSEVFQKIMLPDRMSKQPGASKGPPPITMGVYKESLCLFDQRKQEGNYYYDVWAREMEMWKLIRTILLPDSVYMYIPWPLGLRADGRVHLVMPGEDQEDPDFVLYDLESYHVYELGVKLYSKYVGAFSESLILLN